MPRAPIDVVPGDGFDVGAHVVLFEFDEYARAANGTNYDIHPDGDRLVFIADRSRPTANAGISRNVVITNALNAGGRE